VLVLRAHAGTRGFRLIASFLLTFASLSFAQQNSQATPDIYQPSKRIFWIIPNYRTSVLPVPYTPLRPSEKFKIAKQDTFDRGTVALAALFATQAYFSRSEPSFGTGVPGYARYFAASYGDFAIGNFMTEGIYPTLFRQDPRYFRRGTGSVWSRLLYSSGQIFVTHGDSGHIQFNVSELGGNATAVAISRAYYPQGRNATDAASQFGVQIGVDMASNILKEFEPDVERALFHRHQRKHP
jgi:hypothetical protein